MTVAQLSIDFSKEERAAQIRTAVQRIHDERIYRLAKKLNVEHHEVVDMYLIVHRQKDNAAFWLSQQLGDSHEKYIQNLIDAGENPEFVR
jgi:hypothetical protein